MARVANRADVSVGGGVGKFCYRDLIFIVVISIWPAFVAFLKPLLLFPGILYLQEPSVFDCKMK